MKLLKAWLDEDLGFGEYTLAVASEDASFRRYFRISGRQESVIVMDAPPEKENCLPYIDVTNRLLDCGVHVASIRAQDLDKGFLMLDDLGTELYLDILTEGNANTLYVDAVDSIFRMQTQANTEGLPLYDETLLRQEMELFREWLLGKQLQLDLTSAQQNMIEECFVALIESALEQPQAFVHRDYHSRNLLYNSQSNPGVVDHQDAVRGPVTYDLVSLLKDCYIKWPRAKVMNWAEEYYQQARRCLGLNSNQEQFLRWFDLMGVQRHLKASGIFARLYHRDNKPGFVKDIPRTLSYITDLQGIYAELNPLIALIRERVLPALELKDTA